MDMWFIYIGLLPSIGLANKSCKTGGIPPIRDLF